MILRRRIMVLGGGTVSNYLRFTAQESGTFSFTKAGLSYSTDGTTWTALAANTPTPTIAAGKNIYFKGIMTPSTSSPYGIGTFSSTGNFTASGNIMSLLFGDNFDGQKSLSGKSYAFNQLFYNCTKITSIDDLLLPATTLASSCYYSMFHNCTGLTSIPTGLLPATTLASSCYQAMFKGCTGLTSIPTGLLPATTLATYCYAGMFLGCSSLTSIPTGLLPATTLLGMCYQNMFTYCTSLTNVPSDLLPATTLVTYCYQAMFNGCTSLTTAPSLLATTLATYCYAGMFLGCSSLSSITCLATNISARGCTINWVKDVAASGTFTKAASMSSWTTGNNGIPSGWTVSNQ